MFIIRNSVGYTGAYLLLMTPTYVLPYFGSNSAILNSLSTAAGVGPTPQWWLHFWCIAMLIILTWMRGVTIQKSFLTLFPLVAGFFDLVPVLSSIPLVPTIFHIIGLIMCSVGRVSEEILPNYFKQKIAAIGVLIVTIFGSLFFMAAASIKPKNTKIDVSTSVVQPLQKESSVEPVLDVKTIQKQAIKPRQASKAAPAKPDYLEEKTEKNPVVPGSPKVRYIRLDE